MYICDITLFYHVSLLICDTEINQSINSKKSYSGLVSLFYRESKDSVLQTCWILLAPLRLESYPTDGQTNTQIDVGKTIPRHMRVAGYEYCTPETHSTGVTKTCALFPDCL